MDSGHEPARNGPLALVVRTEQVACVLRLAIGLLLVAMAIVFDLAVAWLAVTTAVTALAWSVLMALALRSGLEEGHITKLAAGSHWFDITLALVVYLTFLPDPEATPVAALPLLLFRLTTCYGVRGAVGGAVVFVGLVGTRIVANWVVHGEGLIRPPLLLAWALVATLVLELALEMRGRSTPAAAPPPIEPPQQSRGAALPLPPLPVTTGDPRIDSLAASLSRRLDTAADAVPLTPREQEVLLLIGQGRSYSSIASHLFISASTVRNHVHNIRGKLEMEGREEVLTLAREVAARTQRLQSGRPGEAPRPVP